jgi:hypothetical protein
MSPLYQTCRSGNLSYVLGAANGTYTVVLKFAEIYCTTAGSRGFNVSMNGTQVLSNFDIVAPGRRRAEGSGHAVPRDRNDWSH